MRKVVCIIQARMGSTRLSGKVMQPILDRPMLWWDVYRVKKARLIDQVVIATTTEPADDAIAALCQREGWAYSRGSEHDVLDRYYQAAKTFNATDVVRITSDCPLIDPGVLDYVISSYLCAAPEVDYVSNSLHRSYPRGLDTEVFSMAALERAWQQATEQPHREHVTLYIYRHPEQFRLQNTANPVDFSSHRWTVDTPEDMELVKHIYTHFGHGDFRWQDILALLDRYPEWLELNRHIEQKKV